MSEILKISRKNCEISSERNQGWFFERRPGGWVVAESKEGRRKRFQWVEQDGKCNISLGGYLWWGEWIQKSGSQVTTVSSSENFVAQFPGKVRKVLIEQGSQVQVGDVLILVEAMKMEFPVRAPCKGQVREVLVVEGQLISPGELLIDWEASESDG